MDLLIHDRQSRQKIVTSLQHIDHLSFLGVCHVLNLFTRSQLLPSFAPQNYILASISTSPNATNRLNRWCCTYIDAVTTFLFAVTAFSVGFGNLGKGKEGTVTEFERNAGA